MLRAQITRVEKGGEDYRLRGRPGTVKERRRDRKAELMSQIREVSGIPVDIRRDQLRRQQGQ